VLYIIKEQASLMKSETMEVLKNEFNFGRYIQKCHKHPNHIVGYIMPEPDSLMLLYPRNMNPRVDC
jgi:hypothetical protein